MHGDSLERLRADILHDRDLPTVPAVVTRILALTESEASSPRDLVEILQVDQVLTARILRVANSSFFACSRQVTTLQRALLVLGYDTVRDLALGVQIWNAFLERDRQAIAELWWHAAAVAVASRLLARELGGVDPGTAFSCGLLHDIGRAALKLHAPESGAGSCDPSDAEARAGERARFGADHAAIGSWMAESWSLPGPLVEAIRDHHRIATGEAPPSAASVVALADDLAHRLARSDTTTDQPPLSAKDAAALATVPGIEPGAWLEIADAVRRESHELSALFGEWP